jgi:hypothetical protein
VRCALCDSTRFTRSEKQLRTLLASSGKADADAEADQQDNDGSMSGSESENGGAAARELDGEDANGDVDW